MARDELEARRKTAQKKDRSRRKRIYGCHSATLHAHGERFLWKEDHVNRNILKKKSERFGY